MTSNATTTNITSNQEPIAIGASTMSSGDLIASAVNDLYDGEMDEVRFSNIARSADWITTQYNNYATPGDLLLGLCGGAAGLGQLRDPGLR